MSGEDRLFFTGCLFTLGVVLGEVCSLRTVVAASFFGAVCFFVFVRFLIEEPEGLRMHLNRVACVCLIMLSGALVMCVSVVRREALAEVSSCISGRVHEAQGIVADVPDVDDEGKWKAVLISHMVTGDNGWKGMRILLTGMAEPESDLQLQKGHIIKACGRFYLPGAPMNPGEPDMGRIMACRRLDGTLYVETEKDIHVLGWRKPNLFQRAADSFRYAVDATSKSTLIPRHARMLEGMLLGKAPSHMRAVLESTGTSHLFAASGLHVGYVALAVMTLLAPFRCPPPVRSAVTLIFIWVYAVACGLRASIVRAALMFSFMAIPKAFGRKITPRSALTLASVTMFAVNPYSVFDAGAQLSFLTVLAILHLYPRVLRLLQLLKCPLSKAVGMSVSAQAGAAPVIAWYFGAFAPIGIIANVPCIVLAGCAVLIGLCATLIGFVFPPAASALNAGNSLVLSGLEKTIELFSRVPFGAFAIRRPPLWFVIVYYVCIIAIGAPRRFRRAVCSRRNVIVLFLLALCVVCMMHQVARRPEVEVTFFSVGQGDAIFIRSAGGKSVLIDGGGLPKGTGDPGRDTIIPFLKRKGVTYIDVVIATHPHYDHIKGLFAVMDSCSAGLLVKPGIPEHMAPELDYALSDLAKNKDVPVVELVKDSLIDIGDGVRIYVLSPFTDTSEGKYTGYASTELNDLSLVMRMEYAGFTLLLTGDAGEAQLDAVLNAGGDLEASVLKVPHHGARDALNSDIAESVKPKVSVISVGPNAFSHPAPTTVTTLEKAGSIVFRTDLDGAVIVRTDGRHMRVSTVKSQRFYKVSS